MDDFPDTQYCQKCGALMDIKLRRTFPYFDRDTGKEVFHNYRYWTCPNKKWFFDGHDKYDDVPEYP